MPAERPRDEARDGDRDVSRDDRRDEPPGRWVPLALAVRELGISRAAVYRRIRAGTLDARPRGNRGLEVLVRDDRDEGRDDRDRLADVSRDETRDIELAELRLRVEQLVERAARAEAEAAATRAQLEREIARADRLEAALAEARRPWLAKVLEGLRRKGS